MRTHAPDPRRAVLESDRSLDAYGAGIGPAGRSKKLRYNGNLRHYGAFSTICVSTAITAGRSPRRVHPDPRYPHSEGGRRSRFPAAAGRASRCRRPRPAARATHPRRISSAWSRLRRPSPGPAQHLFVQIERRLQFKARRRRSTRLDRIIRKRCPPRQVRGSPSAGSSPAAEPVPRDPHRQAQHHRADRDRDGAEQSRHQ